MDLEGRCVLEERRNKKFPSLPLPTPVHHRGLPRFKRYESQRYFLSSNSSRLKAVFQSWKLQIKCFGRRRISATVGELVEVTLNKLGRGEGLYPWPLSSLSIDREPFSSGGFDTKYPRENRSVLYIFGIVDNPDPTRLSCHPNCKRGKNIYRNYFPLLSQVY